MKAIIVGFLSCMLFGCTPKYTYHYCNDGNICKSLDTDARNKKGYLKDKRICVDGIHKDNVRFGKGHIVCEFPEPLIDTSSIGKIDHRSKRNWPGIKIKP